MAATDATNAQETVFLTTFVVTSTVPLITMTLLEMGTTANMTNSVPALDTAIGRSMVTSSFDFDRFATVSIGHDGNSPNASSPTQLHESTTETDFASVTRTSGSAVLSQPVSTTIPTPFESVLRDGDSTTISPSPGRLTSAVVGAGQSTSTSTVLLTVDATSGAGLSSSATSLVHLSSPSPTATAYKGRNGAEQNAADAQDTLWVCLMAYLLVNVGLAAVL